MANKSTLMSRRWVTPVGLTALVAVFVLWCGVPYFRELSRLKTANAGLREEVEAKAGQSKELKELARQVHLVSLEVKDYDRLVPQTQDKGSFSEELSKALEQSGLVEKNRSMLASTRLGKCQALPIELRTSGYAEQFMNFLVALENLPRMSSVSRLMIEADPSLNGQVTADLTLSIYSTASSGAIPK